MVWQVFSESTLTVVPVMSEKLKVSHYASVTTNTPEAIPNKVITGSLHIPLSQILENVLKMADQNISSKPYVQRGFIFMAEAGRVK